LTLAGLLFPLAAFHTLWIIRICFICGIPGFPLVECVALSNFLRSRCSTLSKNPIHFQGYRGASPLEGKLPGNSRKQVIICADYLKNFPLGASPILSEICLFFGKFCRKMANVTLTTFVGKRRNPPVWF
jgi:hypothetical protein